MSDDPLEDVYSFVERAYIRLQAGDILIRCMEENSITPIQQMVESLILAGPQSVDELRQVLAEAKTRRLQVEDDLRQVYADMKRVLGEYGVDFSRRGDFQEALSFTPLEMIVLMSKQGVEDSNRQSTCLRVFQDSRELLVNLNTHLRLLSDIEVYVQDWLLGMTYQIVRQRRPNLTQSEL